uniref:Uncharacterized protein n=1 Tax=Otus sunia TaxID=257818 RepID=A0A8C8AGB9_9STRI
GSQRRLNLERAHRLHSPRNSVTAAISWGILKQLQQKAEDMMACIGAMPMPENTFLAYLALISTNSAVSIGAWLPPRDT